MHMRSMCGIREEAPFVLARLGGLFSYSLMCRRHMYMPRGAISTDAKHPEIRVYAEGRDIDGRFASGDTRSSIRVYTGRRDREASVDTRIHLLKIQLDKIYCAQYNLIKDNDKTHSPISEEENRRMKTVYDFTVKDRQGQDVSLSQYQGKLLLIVNTATGCGFTPQYDPLESMYRDFREKGFEILDFPCNQFADQAPGDDAQIHEFCTMKFGTEFPRFAKIDVNGETADPLFAFLATEKPFEGFGKGLKNAALKKFSNMNNKKFGDKAYIKWNFTKFLIDREGKVIARFEPTMPVNEVWEIVAANL